MCPVTQQPDLSTVVIEYVPASWCIESKSLKLYLWGFRDRAVFAEALAAEIANEVMQSAQPQRVKATLNCRLLPGSPVPPVEAAIVAALNNPEIKVAPVAAATAIVRPPAPPLTSHAHIRNTQCR